MPLVCFKLKLLEGHLHELKFLIVGRISYEVASSV